MNQIYGAVWHGSSFILFPSAQVCSRSPIWDLWRSHSKFVIILVKNQLQSSSNYDHPTMTNTCLGTSSFMPFIFSNFISTPFQCSVWVVSGPASCSDITVIDPARSNTVLDQFSLPPTAPALCICAVPPIGQCWYNGLQQLPTDDLSSVFCTSIIPWYRAVLLETLGNQHCLLSFSSDRACLSCYLR